MWRTWKTAGWWIFNPQSKSMSYSRETILLRPMRFCSRDDPDVEMPSFVRIGDNLEPGLGKRGIQRIDISRWPWEKVRFRDHKRSPIENALFRKRTVRCSKGDFRAKMPRIKDKLREFQRKDTVSIDGLFNSDPFSFRAESCLSSFIVRLFPDFARETVLIQKPTAGSWKSLKDLKLIS
jgi:hypothetical protein